VFQGVGLFPHLTVGENIAVTPKLLGWRKDHISARVAELLEMVDLPADYAGRLPSALSGGQRQRVGVARALAARPRIMLMDEPFGALDPVTRDALGAEYRRLHDRMGLTTLMVTHDVRSEEHTSELQSRENLVCRLLLEKKRTLCAADNTL